MKNSIKPDALEDQTKHLESAREGNQEAFAQLIEPHRHELLVHCYRILGSFEDAEDMLQETLVHAWKRLDTFEGRSSLRAWLYKVATNVCLDALDTRKRRGLSRELYVRGDPTRPLPPPSQAIIWVEPFPDEMVDGQPDIYPEARYEVHESITLAFIAALQIDPENTRIYNNLGLVFSKIGRHEEAFEAFKKGKDEAGAYNNLGYVYMTERNYAKAIEAFERAMELNPSFYEKANQNIQKARLAIKMEAKP